MENATVPAQWRKWIWLTTVLIKPYAGNASGRRGVKILARHQRNHPPQVENIRAALDRNQVGFLLSTLCEKLGYCLPPDERERLISNPPVTVYEFTEAVIWADGEDPDAAD